MNSKQLESRQLFLPQIGQEARLEHSQASGSSRFSISSGSTSSTALFKPYAARPAQRSFGYAGKGERTSMNQWQPKNYIRGRDKASTQEDWLSKGNQANRNQQQHHQNKEPFKKKHSVLNFTSLKMLLEETVEPSKIIRKLTDRDGGLQKLLKDHPNHWDLLELVLIALGDFCAKNGVASFNSDFIAVVQILDQHKVFRNICNIVIQIGTASAFSCSNMPSKEERMKRLIKGILHLGVEMLVLMPAFSCNALGQNFFTDIYGLKDIPSVKALNQTEAFELLKEGCNRLEVLVCIQIILKEQKCHIMSFHVICRLPGSSMAGKPIIQWKRIQD